VGRAVGVEVGSAVGSGCTQLVVWDFFTTMFSPKASSSTPTSKGIVIVVRPVLLNAFSAMELSCDPYSKHTEFKLIQPLKAF
jgi:hypothetical protein